MAFLSPWSFALLSLAGPIIVLYFLKLKRKEVLVPSTFLWRQSINDLRVNAPFQRLRKNLLLFLQLLLLAILTAAIARPAASLKTSAGTRRVILLDVSGSMNAGEGGKTRLDRAKEIALAEVSELERGQGSLLQAGGEKRQMSVITFADRPHPLTAFTSNARILKQVIEKIEPTDRPTRIREALKVAASTLKAEGMEERASRAEIVVISDGLFEPRGEEPFDIPYALRFEGVELGRKNAAITALDARRVQAGGRFYQIFVKVENKGSVDLDKEGVPTLELRQGERLLDAKKVEIKAGEKRTVIFEGVQLEEGIVKVSLDAEDDLPADNAAWTLVEKERDLKVLAAGKNNLFLGKALRVVPHAKVEWGGLLAPENLKARFAEDPALVVLFAGDAPASVPPGNYLFLGVEKPPLPGFKPAGKKPSPIITGALERHPVVKAIDLSQVAISEVFAFEWPPTAVPLVETDKAPLIYAFEAEGYRAIVVAFEPLDSTWPFEWHYPTFLSHALQFLGRPAGVGQRLFLAGEILPISVPPNAGEIKVVNPQGREHTLPATKNRERYFGETSRTGLYTLKIPGQPDKPIPVNFLNSRESTLKGEGRVEIAGKIFKAGPGQIRRAALVWKWFGLAALAMLLLEWWIYNRKLWI